LIRLRKSTRFDFECERLVQLTTTAAAAGVSMVEVGDGGGGDRTKVTVCQLVLRNCLVRPFGSLLACSARFLHSFRPKRQTSNQWPESQSRPLVTIAAVSPSHRHLLTSHLLALIRIGTTVDLNRFEFNCVHVTSGPSRLTYHLASHHHLDYHPLQSSLSLSLFLSLSLSLSLIRVNKVLFCFNIVDPFLCFSKEICLL
jgi:hypothetical protein